MRKNIFKNLLLVLVVALCGLTLVSCGDDESYKYPSQVPTISNPNEVYVTLGEYKVTKNQIFYNALSSHGVEIMCDMLDDAFLPAFNNEGYEAYLNNLIYGDEDITAEEKETEDNKKLYEDFMDGMLTEGLYSEEAIDKYLKLDYRRYLYCLAELTKEANAKEDYFTEAQLENAKNQLAEANVTVILVNYRSEAEARHALEAHNVYTKGYMYDGLYKVAADGTRGEKFTALEVETLFKALYKEAYGKDYAKDVAGNGISNAKFTRAELNEVSTAIASTVFDTLEDGEYTTAPISYANDNAYIAYKYEASETPVTDAEVKAQAIKNALTSNHINYYLFKLRESKNIKIYDEGLEALFAASIAGAYANMKVEYAGFAKTTEESSSVMFSYDGGQKTADQLYTELVGRFGIESAVGYMNQHLVLTSTSFKDVYDIVNDKVLDSTKFQKYYDSELGAFKTQLEAGALVADGYAKTYGFENFLRDQFGVVKANDVIISGALYEDALEEYSKNRYPYSNDASKAIAAEFDKYITKYNAYRTASYETSNYATKLADFEAAKQSYEAVKAANSEAAFYTLQYQMQLIFDKFFSVEGFALEYFADLNGDNLADEFEELATAETIHTYGKALVAYLIEKAEAKDASGAYVTRGATAYDRVAEVVRQYNASSVNSDEVVSGQLTVATIKKAGVKVAVTASTTYSHANDLEEEQVALLKAAWDGITLGLVYNEDGAIEKIASQFASSSSKKQLENTYVVDGFYETESKGGQYVLTAATSSVYNTYGSTFLPSESLIEKYYQSIEKDSTVKLSTAETRIITAYYLKAMEVVEDESELGLVLARTRKPVFASEAVQANYNALKALLEKIYAEEE